MELVLVALGYGCGSVILGLAAAGIGVLTARVI